MYQHGSTLEDIIVHQISQSQRTNIACYHFSDVSKCREKNDGCQSKVVNGKLLYSAQV
jgi:hypothetical protein